MIAPESGVVCPKNIGTGFDDPASCRNENATGSTTPVAVGRTVSSDRQIEQREKGPGQRPGDELVPICRQHELILAAAR